MQNTDHWKTTYINKNAGRPYAPGKTTYNPMNKGSGSQRRAGCKLRAPDGGNKSADGHDNAEIIFGGDGVLYAAHSIREGGLNRIYLPLRDAAAAKPVRGEVGDAYERYHDAEQEYFGFVPGFGGGSVVCYFFTIFW